MAERRPALGKGLSALIPDVPDAPPAPTHEVDIGLLTPSRFQPRAHLDDARLEELAQSIRTNGVIQPIVVRKVDGAYHIIAGERRWRAAQRAGLLRVPVVVRDIAAGDERKLLEIALIENLQRDDLNPLEEAGAYRRLQEEFGLTQEAIAKEVGKDRASVANALRLLRLPADVRQEVAAGRLSAGHARALLSLENAAAVSRAAAQVLHRGLSVRETEELVRRLVAGPRKPRTDSTPDVHTRAAQDEMSKALGARVRIVRTRRGGTIVIPFSSEDELQRLYEIITGHA